MHRKSKVFKRYERNLSAYTNVLLSVILLLVGIVCFTTEKQTLPTDGKNVALHRSGDTAFGGVSLLINVYWGTDEVYSMLDILKKYDGKATFFIGGCWADDNVACLRAIVAGGHEIGNHGYFHKQHDQLSLKENTEEIARCNAFLQTALGVQPTLFAPPSGAYNDVTLNACQSLNMKTILWSRDTIDWRDKNAALIYTRATKNVQSGDFILMHPMQATVDALEDIIKYYASHNLKLVTVSENLREKG